MVIYNVTVGIDKDVEQEWLSWMIDEHIPKVLDCGLFINYNIFKVLSQDEESTTSYSIQYHARSMDEISQYLENHAPKLAAEHQERFKDKHVAFRSLLEKIS